MESSCDTISDSRGHSDPCVRGRKHGGRDCHAPAAIVGGPIGGDAYARRNGFTCTSGTWFRGDDGRRHICQ